MTRLPLLVTVFDVTQHPVNFLCTLFTHIELLVHQDPRSLSTQLLSIQVDLILCCTPGSCLPRRKTLHLSLLNFIKFLIAHSSSLYRCSCGASLLSKGSTSPLSLVSLTNFSWVKKCCWRGEAQALLAVELWEHYVEPSLQMEWRTATAQVPVG